MLSPSLLHGWIGPTVFQGTRKTCIKTFLSPGTQVVEWSPPYCPTPRITVFTVFYCLYTNTKDLTLLQALELAIYLPLKKMTGMLKLLTLGQSYSIYTSFHMLYTIHPTLACLPSSCESSMITVLRLYCTGSDSVCQWFAVGHQTPWALPAIQAI